MQHTHRHVVRFTLEALTPLSVGTGFGSGLFDTELVRDANSLPTIPGTALAGVLSSLFRQRNSEQDWHELFGNEEQNAEKNHAEKGRASRLEVSFGCIHDQHDRAIEGLLTGAKARERLESDPLLQLAARAAPLHRDHVAIDHRGTAKESLKFDRVSLPPGYRFSFEIAMRGGENEFNRLIDVVRLVKSPDFRIGGASRRGLGKFAVVSQERGGECIFGASFDLATVEGRERFASYRQRPIDETPNELGFERLRLEADGRTCGAVSFELKLRALDFWRFGQGMRQLMPKLSEKQKDADSLPLTEVYIRYAGGKGSVREGSDSRVAIPASAVKGALLHRAEFYLKCDQKLYADEECCDDNEFRKRCDTRGMDVVAGQAKDREGRDCGLAGLLLIDDAYIDAPPETMLVAHNSIDRFSGGVMDGRLFVEEVLYGGTVTIRCTALAPRGAKREITDAHRKALDRALADLCEGRLALGADGHGYFKWAGEGGRPTVLHAFGRAA